VAYDPASLETGDVVLVWGGARTPQGRLLDVLILWLTGGPTHAALAVGPGKVIEAVDTVRVSDADQYARIGYAYRVRDATPDQRTEAVLLARKRLGRPYGTRELFYDAARFALHWTPKPRTLSRTTCSGLVAICYVGAGMPLTYAPWPAPADLLFSPALVGKRP
jgi:hypothetical protein